MVLKLDQPVRETDLGREFIAEPAEASADGSTASTWRFRLTVVKHHRAVYRLCRGLLRDPHEAEDVTQETFLRYWQNGDGVRGIKAWLLTVARNACLDRLRRSHRCVESDPSLLELQPDERDPEWHAARQESADVLTSLVDALPEPQRSLVLMFDVEGLTGAECADALGLNITQVKVYLHRARRRLRSELEVLNDKSR